MLGPMSFTDTFRHATERFNESGDVDALASLLASDVRYHFVDPSTPDRVGRDEVAAMWTEAREATNWNRHEILSLSEGAEGLYLDVARNWRGTTSALVAAAFRVVNGAITNVWQLDL